jgi:hypothetical protein
MRAKARSYRRGLGTRVTAANDDYVEVEHSGKLLNEDRQRLDAQTHSG